MTVAILPPIADNFINSGSPSTKYDTATYLTVYTGLSYQYSLLKFDVSSIPVNAFITSAILELYFYDGTSGDAYTIDAHKITSSWDYRVAWSTQPTIDATKLASKMVYGVGDEGFKSFDITSLVAGWINGTITNYGVFLKSDDVTNTLKYFYSSNFATVELRPKLTVTYITPTQVNIGGTWKDYANGWVNIGGVWKQIDTISVNVGGVWK